VKPELDRVKHDLETIQNAMGLSPALAEDWVRWLKRDRWLFLWWCLPGAMIIAIVFSLAGRPGKYFGYNLAQWAVFLTAAIALGLFFICIRKTTANDGRPPGLIREYRRYWGLDAQGKRGSLAFLLGCALYFFWAWRFHLSREAFVSGSFIIAGSIYLVSAIISKLWLLLGIAVPLLGYGLFTVLHSGNGMVDGIPLGITFIAIGLCSYLVSVWQIRKVERQNESH